MNKTTFTEDLENNRLIAVRTFDVPVEKVWKAWSDPAILCQWWAPQPYTCQIDEMDFKEGGYWIYNMVGPEGDLHRGRMDYLKIELHKQLEAEDYFVDEDGNASTGIPPMQMSVKFDSNASSTTVTSITTFASAEAFKQMAEMGMAEGWELACNQLEALLV
ncbi:SRPBCC domain-containing protein [Ekhidna sp.]|uniref:SRPBCC family protein n=1 Tax=Ekhidna sp. TaxID=2608089 RepID=UPI00329A4B47